MEMHNPVQTRQLLDEIDFKISPDDLKTIGQNCWMFFKVNPAGRTLWKLFQDKYVNQTSFDADPLVMAFKEGRRNMFLRLNELINDFEERNNINERNDTSNGDTGSDSG